MEKKQNQTISMADNTKKKQKPKKVAAALRIVSKTRILAFISVLVYTILIFSLWNLLQKTLCFSWFIKRQIQLPYYYSSFELPSLYASMLLIAVFGLVSISSAIAVMVPATVVTWITIVVLLSFIGKSRRTLAAEGRRITKEIIFGFVVKILFKAGNVFAAVFAVLGYFVVIGMN